MINQLGAGGFGQTFLAQDLHLPGHPLCVVKQFKPQVTDPAHLEMASRLFETEAKVLYQLGEHPQIPRLLAHFEEEQEFYLVQEFIEGCPLSQLLTGQRWDEKQVIALLRDILPILDFVHQRLVIHRDIKPSNLMVRQLDQRMVLIDFGAVKQVSAQFAESNTGLLTVSIGTEGYMPIEQLSGHPRFSSDLYAVGMVGIQALTGMSPKRIPLDPQTGEISWRSVLLSQPDAVPVHSTFAAILDRMVCYHFKERYQTATEILQAFDALLAGQPDLSLTDALVKEAETNLPPLPSDTPPDVPSDAGSEPQLDSALATPDLIPAATNFPEEATQSSGQPSSPPTVPEQAGVQPSVQAGIQPSVSHPTVINPTVANPTVANPTIASPTVISPTVANPTVAGSSPFAIPSITPAVQEQSPELSVESAVPRAELPGELAELSVEPPVIEPPAIELLVEEPPVIEPPVQPPSPSFQATAAATLSQSESTLESLPTRPRADRLDTLPTTAVAPGALAPVPEPLDALPHVSPNTAKSASRPWYRSWLSFVLLGLGSVGIIGTSLILSQRLHPQVRSGITPDPLPDLPCPNPTVPTVLPAKVDYEYPDGTRYYGATRNGLPIDGKAIMVFPSGNRYDGAFKNGQRNGCGKLSFTNGRSYVGQFQDDQMEGTGTWILENGDRYVGDFKNNRCHGLGTFVFADGSLKQGEWRDGKMVNGDLECDR